MSDLRAIHQNIETNSSGRFIAAILILVAIGGLGAYSYEAGMWRSPPAQIVPDSALPAPGQMPFHPGH